MRAMSPTDAETLRGLAHLARLELSEEEVHALAPELERILEAFGVLARHVPEPVASEDGRSVVLREDMPVAFQGRAALLAAASESEDGFFVAPKTIGGEA